MAEISIRASEPSDADAVWEILEPIIRGGRVFAYPRDLDRHATFARWCPTENEVYVAEIDGEVVGTAYIRDNPLRPKCGIANAGYAIRQGYEGLGIARALCLFSLNRAAQTGYKTMQFNHVISSNERAVRLWKSCGFEVAEVLPKDFDHPDLGLVDAFVMTKTL